MRRALLLAHPAGHSLSPPMQNAAFSACGIDADYTALDVPPAQLGGAVEGLRAPDVLGANVTVPHKRAMRALLDDVTDAAAAIGAVNTVVRSEGRLRGDNTDADGFTRALAEAGVGLPARRVLLLGAGGAARAVAWALLRDGVGHVRVWNRSPERAEGLVHELGDARLEATGRPDPGEYDLVVNATSVGMVRGGLDPDASPLPTAWPAADGVAVDIVYRPRRTRFLTDAQAAGWRTVDGVGMLLHQGAASFERWTGQAAPVDAMREALEASLTKVDDSA